LEILIKHILTQAIPGAAADFQEPSENGQVAAEAVEPEGRH